MSSHFARRLFLFDNLDTRNNPADFSLALITAGFSRTLLFAEISPSFSYARQLVFPSNATYLSFLTAALLMGATVFSSVPSPAICRSEDGLMKLKSADRKTSVVENINTIFPLR